MPELRNDTLQGDTADGRARRLAALLRLSAELGDSLDEDDICHRVVRGLEDESLGYNFVALFLIDFATKERVLRASVGWTDLPDGWRIKAGEGLSYRAIEDGEVHYTADVRLEPSYVPGLKTGSEVDLPLFIDDRPAGLLVVESERPNAFGTEDLEILTAAATQASIAIGRARLIESQRELLGAERRRVDEQRALIETLADLSTELELSTLLQAVLERAVSLLRVSAGELATFDETNQTLVIAAVCNTGTVSVGTRLSIGEGAMGRVAETHEPLMIDDYAEWPGRSEQYAEIQAHAVAVYPLLMGGRLVGAFSVWHSDCDRQFDHDDMRLLNMFAPQAAVAIANAKLFAASNRQKQYFEELVRNSPVAIVTLDVTHNVVSCNPSFEHLYGYAEAEVVGKNLDDLITSDATRSQAVGFTTKAEHRAVKGLGLRRRKDGTLVDVEVSAVPVIVDGERVGMMGLYHDITELLAARRDAESANSAKSQFLASMSHELRTPLNAILGYSEMLQEEAEDAGQPGFIPDLKKIHSAGHHLLTLINDVLDLSKIEAGKMDLYLETFAVGPILDEVVTTVNPLVEKNGNRLILDAADDLGSMHSDLTRVRQILFNLLSNSSKFTENGTITLAAERRDRGDGGGGGELVLSVRDTGIGMTQEQLGRLFEAFSQAEVSTSSKYGGTGLGLTITKRFCEMMGGNIAVDSKSNKGSTFTVTLPLHTAEKVVRTEDDERPPTVATLDTDGDGAGTVLVIDDDLAVRELMQHFLGREGFRVYVAADGSSGLELAREIGPDVITLDVLMPGMDGWSVLAALKADSVLSVIPVVMVTIVDDKNMGFTLGAAGYLSKPVDREILTRTVERLVPATASRRILVVEDDEATRDVLRRSLEGAGWTVDEAANGRVALEQMDICEPNLILLDLMMPEMNGFEFLEVVKAHHSAADTPVVVLTAKDLTPEDRERLNGSVERIVEKGTHDRKSLLREIRALVTTRSSRVHATPAEHSGE